MALTIQKQPDQIILSGNPVEFIISSNTVVQSNHKIHIRIYSSINLTGPVAEQIGEESLPVINNSASFDISDYLKADTPLNLTIFDLFSTFINRFRSVVRFYVRIYETYNSDGINHNPLADISIFAINGGFSKIFLNNYNAAGKTFLNDFITTDKKFLTWSPDKKLTWNQHDFLWFIVLSQVHGYSKITLTFDDTTTQEIISDDHLIYANCLSYLNTSFLSNQLDSYETESKKITSYTVQVFNGSDVALTEAKTYYIDRSTYNNFRQFIFRNSLGGYDIIALKGISENTNEIQRTIGYFETKDSISHSEFAETYKAASGFVVNHYNDLASAQRYIIELFNSKEIYEIVGREIVPIIQQANKIKLKKDDEFLYSFVFEYNYAYTDEFFAPFDTEQYLNPRIFYSNGIIDDVNPGQTATVDFDVWVNDDITIDFTLDWGDDVGITYLSGVVMVDGVLQSLSDSINIPGNVEGIRTLTISDSIGGKYYIEYEVADFSMLFNDDSEMLFNDDEEMNFNY